MIQQWIDIEGRRIGLRWSAPGLDADLRAALRLSVHDGDAPGNISVIVGASAHGVREKHQLYVQGKLVLISAHAERVTRAIVRAIGDLTAPEPNGTLPMWASVVFDPDGRAILVDRQLQGELWVLDRRLRRAGWRVVDTSQVQVDVATSSLILNHAADLVVDGYTPTDSAVASQSDWRDGLHGGRIPISRIVFMGTADGASLAQTLAEATPMVWQRDYSLRVADVDSLLELLRHVEARGAAPDDAASLRAALGLP